MSDQSRQDVTIRSGSTVWDWILSDHPHFKIALLGLGLIFLLLITARISWTIPVFLVLSMVIGALMFRNVFLDADIVRVVTTYDDDPTAIDILLIGKNRFSRMEKTGAASPFTSTKGDPVFIANDYRSGRLTFPWSFQESRLNFILDRGCFDRASKLAEESSRRLYEIEHIPQILGLQEARKYVQKHESYYSRILNGEEMDSVVTDAKEELDDVRKL